jgi:hypothetical protein
VSPIYAVAQPIQARDARDTNRVMQSILLKAARRSVQPTVETNLTSGGGRVTSIRTLKVKGRACTGSEKDRRLCLM